MTFGLVGRHPLVALVVQVALVAAAAVLLRALLVRFVDGRIASTAALLWLVIPNHGSLTHWATATALTVALVLLLGGLWALDEERHVAAAVLLAASVLCYEATAPAALVGMVALPMLRRRPSLRPAAVGAAVLGPVGAWMVVNLPSVKDEGLARTADLSLVVPAHIGWGVFPAGGLSTAGGAAAAVVLVLVAVESARRRRVGAEAMMVAAGVAVIVLGTVPFVRYFYAPLGAGDRVNVVAGVGTALVWTGLGTWLWRRTPRALAAPAAAAVLGAMAVASWQGSMAWADAADDAARALRVLGPVGAGDTVVVERPPVRRNVAAFADRSNIASAVQLEAGTRDVDAALRPAR